MGCIILSSLSIFLGLFFILGGTLKISPALNKEIHSEIRRNFVHYAKVFPFSKTLDFKIPSKYYRVVVGWMEVLCGISLVFVPGVLKVIANVLLLVLMVGASYTHTVIEEKFESSIFTSIFALMLAGRLIVHRRVHKHQNQD